MTDALRIEDADAETTTSLFEGLFSVLCFPLTLLTPEWTADGQSLDKSRPEKRGAIRRISLGPLAQKLLDGISVPIGLLNADGAIVAHNRAWRTSADEIGLDKSNVGDNYVEVVVWAAENGDKAARAFLDKLTALCAGKLPALRQHYIGTGPFRGRNMKIVGSSLQWNAERLVLLEFRDENDLLELRKQRRRLGNHLMRAQEHERRRMASDLHDSASQLLVGLQLNLMQLKRERDGPNMDQLLADCSTTIDLIQNEIRTFTFIHHPPSLATEGIGTTVEKLVAGFARRTGLEVETCLDEIRGASHSIEATLYRVAQEALANVHRHARATTVRVWLEGTDTLIHLTIEDDGIGFDGNVPKPPALLGVGIMGMTERVAEFGGDLSFRKLTKGTSLTATLPYRA